jgi:hypothetical protein
MGGVHATLRDIACKLADVHDIPPAHQKLLQQPFMSEGRKFSLQ